MAYSYVMIIMHTKEEIVSSTNLQIIPLSMVAKSPEPQITGSKENVISWRGNVQFQINISLFFHIKKCDVTANN